MNKKFQKKAYELRRKEAEKSLYAFALTYLSHHLEFLPSAAHIEVYDELTAMFDERGRKYAIAAPRNFGKSTMITGVGILYGICYSKEKFIVIISGTEDQARAILNNIRQELTQNEKLRQDFPEIFEKDGQPRPPRWRQRDIITRNGVEVLALGWNQKIRGRKHGNSRPTAVFLDDVENSDNTFSYESRESVREWFMKEVLKAGSERTNYFLIGNLFHQDSLLAQIVDPTKHPTWTKKVYRAIVSDPVNVAMWEDWFKIFNGHSDFNGKRGPEAALAFYEVNQVAMDDGAATLWPGRWSYYSLRVMYEEDPISFTSEMQNRPFDRTKQLFNIDEFHYWDKIYRGYEELVKAFPKLVFFAACDPSLGLPGLKGDFSAIIILAKDRATNTIYVVVADIKRRSLNETIDDIVSYQMRFKCEAFGYEVNQFQRTAIQQIEDAAKERGVRIPLREITNTKNKVLRIQSLDRWVRNGTVQFKQQHRLLLEQLRDFPQGKYDDGPDALEMAIQLAQKGDGLKPITVEII